MSQTRKANPLVVKPEDGRLYEMGRMSAVFKADLEETDWSLSVSEWRLEPSTEGPHIHKHPEAHLFYVIEGVLTVYIEGENWFDSSKGAYIYIPGQTEHTFENRSDSFVTFMSINTPGGFEKTLPNIVSYLVENPLGDAKKST